MSEDEGREFSDEIKKTVEFCGLTSENIRVIESYCRCGSNRLLKYMDRYELHPEVEIGLLFQSNYDGVSRVSLHRLSLLSEEADVMFREAKEMFQDKQPDPVKINLWSVRIFAVF
ncbi:hypothetical protein OUZ56_017542 [Daphnia magna]|uniref:Uncharacterized protein n=1 Tax=Daphnia magna TaxID=35525 RepID=A0ABR0AT20_9CRUS|nr:hypothetical protein OUZ56_017542 [Daphnia magna]